MVRIEIVIDYEDGVQLPIALETKGKTTSYQDTETESRKKEEATDIETEDRKEPLKKVTPAQKKRYDIASDLANVCEYLEEVEIMKIKLIIEECERRAKR